MDDYPTQDFRSQDPGGPASPDWDEEDPEGPKVLWGRVVVLAVLLLLAFLLGRVTAPGTSEEDLDEATASLAAAEERIEALEEQNEELQADAEATPDEELTPDETPTDASPTEPIDENSVTYVVESGDTIQAIAETCYGDGTLDEVIEEANGITDPTLIRAGDELIIPPEEDGSKPRC